jgi:putative oxidoreductase
MKYGISLGCQWLIAGTFLWAGMVHLWHDQDLVRTILHYRLVSEWTALLLARLIPPCEVVVGVCLLLQVKWQGALVLAMIMLMLFSAVLLQAWMRGLDIHCGCFGANGWSTAHALVRDLVLLGIAGLAYVTRLGAEWPDRSRQPHHELQPHI